MASAIQLNFTLRTSSNCKTVHLLGSWDTYRNPLPLSKDASKSGGWKGTFRFQDTVLQQGQRYWYYYIIDGYHVSHDPARDHVTEPTTGRKLNILNIPKAAAPQPSAPSKSSRDARHSRRASTNCAKGRPLSVSDIKSPLPRKPEQMTRQIRNEQFRSPTLEQLSAKFAAYQLDEDDEDDDSEIESGSDSGSDISSDVPSLTSRSSRSSAGSGASSPSSVSSAGSSCCTCNRFGLTRAGDRVKLDCGGRQCGYSDGSDCSSDSDGDYRRGMTRRNGVVVRH